MTILSATFNAFGGIDVVVSQPPDEEGDPQPNVTMMVPDDMANRERRRLDEWLLSENRTIAPYVEPPKSPEVIRNEEFKALPETIDIEDKLKNATPAQIRAYLTANMTTLPQAREIIARMLIYMASKV